MPDIPVWPQCNINCVFCSNPEEFRDTCEKYSFEKFARNWGFYRKGRDSYLKFAGVNDFISLTGGEPTIHPQFLKILKLLRNTWPKKRIKLLTNARMFRYEKFARSCLEIAGTPFEVAIPFMGHDRRTYEAISRTPGSFSDVVAGLDNLFGFRGAGQKIQARVILHRIQMRNLKPLLDFMAGRYGMLDCVELLFPEFEGIAEKNLSSLKMGMKECGSMLAGHIEDLEAFKNIHLLHFPFCALPRRLWPWTWVTLDPIKVVHSLSCGRCRARDFCVGIHKSYAKHCGVGEFRPAGSLEGVTMSGDRYHPVLEVKG